MMEGSSLNENWHDKGVRQLLTRLPHFYHFCWCAYDHSKDGKIRPRLSLLVSSAELSEPPRHCTCKRVHPLLRRNEVNSDNYPGALARAFVANIKHLVGNTDYPLDEPPFFEKSLEQQWRRAQETNENLKNVKWEKFNDPQYRRYLEKQKCLNSTSGETNENRMYHQ